YDEEMPAALRSEIANGAGQRGLEPLSRPHFALVTEQMGRIPPALFNDSPHGAFDLTLIRIALFNEAHRHPVRAEDEVNFSWIVMRQFQVRYVYVVDNRVDVLGVRMILTDDFGGGWSIIQNLRLPVPFPDARTGRRFRVLRIEGQKDYFFKSFLFQF